MKISIVIEALTGSFETDMKRASKAAEKAAKQVQEDWKKVGVVVGSAVASVAASLALLTKNSIDNADNLAKMAQKVGVSVEALSTLAYAADQSGVSLEQLQGGLVKLAKNASDAAMGTGTAVNAFDALGISVKNADGSLKGTDVLLREVAVQFAKYEDGANKTAIAVGLFGRAGAELIPLLNEGADGIGALEDRARSLGLEIGGETAAQAEAFNDLMSDMANLAKGLGNDIAKELLPYLNSLSEEMVESGIQTREASGAAEALATTFQALATSAIVIKNGIEQLTIATAAFVDTAAAVGTFANDLNPLTQAWRALNGEVKPVGDSLTELTSTLSAVAASAETGLIDAFEDGARAVMAFLNPVKETNKALGADGGGKGLAPGMRNVAKAASDTEKALKELDKEWADYAKIVEDVRRDHEQIAKDYAAQQAHFTQQRKDIEDEITLLGLSGEARERMAIALEAERLARDRNGDVVEEEKRQLEGLLTTLYKEREAAEQLASVLSEIGESEFDRLRRTIEEIGEELKKATDPEVIDRLRDALGNADAELKSGMIESFKALLGAAQSFKEEGSAGFKDMQKGMAALSLVQDILALKAAVTAVLTQGEGEPYSAWARMAAMAAAVAPFLASIGQTLASFGGGSFSRGSTAEVRQEMQGTGTVLGDAEAKSESILNAIEITADATTELVGLSRGQLRALQAMVAGIGGASNALARGVGDVEFNYMPDTTSGFLSTFTSPLLQSVLGGSSEVTDQGILILGGALSDLIENISVGAFQEVQSRSWRFGRTRTNEEVRDLGDDVAVQFQLILNSMADAVAAGAEALGLNMQEVNAAIAAFEIEEIRISTMDLTAEEARAELEAVFSSIFDDLAGSVVPFIAQFQQVGEGLGETLVRVATSVQVTQEAILQLGLSLEELDPEHMAQVSVALIEAAGGIESFIDGMQTFVSAFASEEHQFAVAQDALTRAFEQVGLTIPATRDAMWTLMQSLDATTESGREQIATLLRLAGVADGYYNMLEDRAEGVAGGAGNIEAAARAYADFIAQFETGSDFANSLRELSRSFAASTDQANDLARAAGLQGARVEDLARIEEDYLRTRERMIGDLTATIVQQIAELYGTSAAEIEAQIAAIDTELSSLADMRSEGTFGLVMAMAREAQLQAERAGLEAQLAQQAAAEEAIRRQTGALDLARNLADLGLARGVGFEQLAQEFGIDLNAFGSDLGVAADGIDDLIAQLQEEAFTAEDYESGVDRIVSAIMEAEKERQRIDNRPPDNIDPPREPDNTGGKAADLSAEVRSLRIQTVATQEELRALGQAQLEEMRELVRYARAGALDPTQRRSSRMKVG